VAQQPVRRHYSTAIAKRIIDICLATTILVVSAPLQAVVALAIRLDTKGPIIYRQRRMGRGARAFTMLKFRSMFVDADEAPHRDYVTRLLTDSVAETNEKGTYKISADPRITRVGRIIRRFSIDEIPQFYNVLKGDMSIVGPRPALPFEVELYDLRYMHRFDAKPGLTGLWQVSGRNRLGMIEMLDLDLDYVERQSIVRDLHILMKTPGAVLRGDGAE